MSTKNLDLLSPAAGAKLPQVSSGLFLRLHLLLWQRALRSQPAVWAFLVLMVVYGWGLAAAGAGLLTEFGLATWVGIPAVGVLLFWALSALLPNTEQQLDATYFAQFPIHPRRLMLAMATACFLQLRSLIALITMLIFSIAGAVLLAQGITTGPRGLLIIGWILANIYCFLLAIFGGPVVDSLLTLGGSSRYKEYGYLGFVLSMLVVGVAASASQSDAYDPLSLIFHFCGFLAWTPLAVPVAAWYHLTASNTGWGLVFLGGSIALLPLLFWAWLMGVRSQFQHPLNQGSATRITRQQNSVFTGLWRQPTLSNALISRQWRYIFRDSRQLMEFILGPFLISYFLALAYFTDNASMLLVGGFAALNLASGRVANYLGIDGPANWLHITCGLPAKSLVQAKIKFAALYGLLACVGYLSAALLLGPRDGTIALLIPLLFGGLGCTLAITLLVSTHFPFPAPRPGSNPFKDTTQGGTARMLIVLPMLFGMFLPLAPGLGLCIFSVWRQGFSNELSVHLIQPLYLLGVALSLAIGSAALLLSLHLSARHLAANWPDIFTKVRHWGN